MVGTGMPRARQLLEGVHELAVALDPAILEFEGMDVVVLAIALRVAGHIHAAAPVAFDPEVIRSAVSKIRTLCHCQSGSTGPARHPGPPAWRAVEDQRVALAVFQEPPQPSSVNSSDGAGGRRRGCACTARRWPVLAPQFRGVGKACLDRGIGMLMFLGRVQSAGLFSNTRQLHDGDGEISKRFYITGVFQENWG